MDGIEKESSNKKKIKKTKQIAIKKINIKSDIK
jgi:hypothetical protein